MDDPELHSLMERLHAEVERSDKVDDEERELLRHLTADIQALLARSEGGQAVVESTVVKRVEDTIDQYEVTHPDLTLLLTKLLSILNNAGI